MGNKDDVKNAIDIVDYIGKFVNLRQSGRNFSGLCPFHKEKSPSFFVSPERQSYHCFGCGVGGDIFEFYMAREGVEFGEALKDLADIAGIELTNFKPDASFNLRQTLIDIHNLSADYYHYLLLNHKSGKKSLEYIIKKRGITQTQIKDFKIGFAPNSWHSLYDFLAHKKHFKNQDLESSGLILNSNNRFYDRFRGRIMFPLKDTRGNIVGFSGRVLPWTDDGKMGKYINSPETPIYHKSKMLFPLFYTKDVIREKQEVIVVEGELDALASIRANIKNVVAIKGTAFTQEQVKLLSRYCETIILCLDSDQSGVKAAIRSINVIENQELNCRVIELEGGKDPDELVNKDPKLWRETAKKTIGIYDFLINISVNNNPSETIESKKAITKEIIPVLEKIQNQVVKDHYIKKLAQILNTQSLVIEQELERHQKKSQLTNYKETTKGKINQETRLSQLLTEFLALVLQNYKNIEISKIPINDFPTHSVTKILVLLIEKNPKDIIYFSKSLPSELQPQFDQSYLMPEEILDKTKLDKKFISLISEIAKISLRDKLSQLRNSLSNKENSNNQETKQQINNVLLQLRSYN